MGSKITRLQPLGDDLGVLAILVALESLSGRSRRHRVDDEA